MLITFVCSQVYEDILYQWCHSAEETCNMALLQQGMPYEIGKKSLVSSFRSSELGV